MRVFISNLRTLFMKVLVTLVETVLTGKLFHTRRKRNVKYSFLQLLRQNAISKRLLWPRKLDIYAGSEKSSSTLQHTNLL